MIIAVSIVILYLKVMTVMNAKGFRNN